jgi:cation transporter-like permease
VSLRRAFLTYTLGRLGLFLLVAVIVWGASGLLGSQVNGLTLLLLALIGSSVLAVFVLRGQRDRFGQAIAADRAAKAEVQAARRARLNDGPTP